MTVLDANMILRYLLNDNAAMAETAERYIEAGNASVTIEVMAEVVYVLKGVYFMERDLIAQTLECVSKMRHVQFRVDLPAFQGDFPQA